MYTNAIPALIINIQVDSLAVLSGSPIDECIWVVDSSPLTAHKGGPSLRSIAMPGQRVRWTLTSVDLQAPAWLKKINFVPRHESITLRRSSDPSDMPDEHAPHWPSRAVTWEGYVPPAAIVGASYPYDIHLSFGDERGVPFIVSGSEIEIHTEPLPEFSEGSGSTWANEAFVRSGGVL